MWIASDGTGHSSQYAGAYYTQRTPPHRKQCQRKRYTRNQIAVEIADQVRSSHLIIAQRVARGSRHEAKDALPLIMRTKAIHPVGYSMDTAYDSEEIRRMVVEEVGAACGA